MTGYGRRLDGAGLVPDVELGVGLRNGVRIIGTMVDGTVRRVDPFGLAGVRVPQIFGNARIPYVG